MDDDIGFIIDTCIEPFMPRFSVIHIHNQSLVYHLTGQLLQDLLFSEGQHCLFYQILDLNAEVFNRYYGSFATLLARSDQEADLYLNVDPEALSTVIQYIQTSKLVLPGCYVSHVLDLAVMFGMCKMVSDIRHITDSQFDVMKEAFKQLLSRCSNIDSVTQILDKFCVDNQNELHSLFNQGLHVKYINLLTDLHRSTENPEHPV